MRSHRSWRTILATCIVAATALLAPADIDAVTPSVATIGTHVSVDGSGFGTAKAPRAKLVPQTAGNKTLPLKVLPGFSDTHIDVVVSAVKAQQVGAYDLVVTPAGKGAVALTNVGAVTIGFPDITSFTPQAPPGGQFTIDGSLFGSKKGFVKVGIKKTKIVSWTDTRIVAKISKKSALGVLGIWVHNKVGNRLTTVTGITVAK